MVETKSNYGYAPKSRIIYSRKGLNSAASKRSKTSSKMSAAGRFMVKEQVGPFVGETESQIHETKSKLNQVTMKRFNEEIPDGGPKS